MKVCALASGSSGNCFYVRNNDSSVLIDAGISCKRVVDKLTHLGEDPSKIKGIFISHEHSDHIKGADVLARKFNIPVFATKGVIKNSFLCSQRDLINEINSQDLIKLGGMEIESFSKNHDSREPVSFSIRNGRMISVLTDIGKICKNVINKVGESDFLFLEANHDLRMLENGPYPYFVKQRIKGEGGHLSNLNSALCVLEHGRPILKNVVLSHLSEINNTPELALNTFELLMRERLDLHPRISVSLRNPTKVFSV